MQFNDKNEHKNDKKHYMYYKDNVVQMTFYAFQSHISAVHIYMYVLWIIGGRRE